ncbi:MAG: tetratricopeptide repeat protein, partial [Thermoguttaceae bacterium]
MRRFLRVLVLPVLALLLVAYGGPLASGDSKVASSDKGPASASPAPQVGSEDVPLVSQKVRQWMQDGNYAEAIKAIQQAAKRRGGPADYLTWLEGWAWFLDRKYDEAVALFDALEKRFPKSPWVRRARFAKALTFARKGDFRTAELIYRAEAEYLLSADRKQEIADLYLEFADRYFKPPKEQDKPDYAKALEFYRKALEVGPKPQRKIEVELLVAQCQQHLGKLDEAARLYEQFLKEHPQSPLEIEARFRLGQCQLAQGKFKDARRTWQDLLAEYPDCGSERVAEAAFELSRTWGIPP